MIDYLFPIPASRILQLEPGRKCPLLSLTAAVSGDIV